jgi:hypothetical protein
LDDQAQVKFGPRCFGTHVRRSARLCVGLHVWGSAMWRTDRTSFALVVSEGEPEPVQIQYFLAADATFDDGGRPEDEEGLDAISESWGALQTNLRADTRARRRAKRLGGASAVPLMLARVRWFKASSHDPLNLRWYRNRFEKTSPQAGWAGYGFVPCARLLRPFVPLVSGVRGSRQETFAVGQLKLPHWL